MHARQDRWLARIAARVSIVALASALLCATIGSRPAHQQASGIELTAAIDQSSSTLGFADSDLSNTGMTQAEIDQQLDTMQSLGVQNVRILIPWVTIEERQGEYSWDYIDYIVDAANSRGMGILGVINQTPLWAGVPVMAGMPDPEVFGGFAEKVATRYAGKISAYEIWNEPNAVNSLDPVDPAAYTRLLQAAYPLMKQVDPSITVIGGVVGAGRTLGPLAMNPDDFIEGMYAAGAKGYFDALSFHPYEYSMTFSAGAGVAGSPLEQLTKIMQIMADNGDGDLKVWASEYGQPTTGQYTAQQQAEFLQDFLDTWSQLAGTGPMFVYTLQDTDSGSANLQDNFGVYYSDGTAKPAVQVILDFLNPDDPTAPVDPADPTQPAPGNPLVHAVAAALHWVGATTRAVVNGVVTAVVDVAKFTASVLRAVVRATVNVIRRGVAAAESVVKGVVTATKNAVHPATAPSAAAEAPEPAARTAEAVADDVAAEPRRSVRKVRSADTPRRAAAPDRQSLQEISAADDEDDTAPSRATPAERRTALTSDKDQDQDTVENSPTADRTSGAGSEASDAGADTAA